MVQDRYFFCGIGGSGMLPLAMFLKAGGAEVRGSDRAIDQGRADAVRQRLERAGIDVFPQDGSGLDSAEQTLVTSSAVEAHIPDVAAASRLGAHRRIRAEILARLTNEAPVSCGIAGTSGKSTTTGMLAHILVSCGLDPSVVNGAPILNLKGPDGHPVAWRQGQSGPFVCEVDESDGSIARYNPSVGVILNVSEDHKPMAELEDLFGGYAERSGKAVLGIDSEPVALIAKKLAPTKAVTFSLAREADVRAVTVTEGRGGLKAELSVFGETLRLELPMMGRFNVANALAAIAAATLLGASPKEACEALSTFEGTARRLQRVGEAHGVTVIDDFAHNPEKIAGSVEALKRHYGRLHLVYQPHGYGPLRSFRSLYEASFAGALGHGDRLFVTEPGYFGGTVEKSDDARLLTEHLAGKGLNAAYLASREDVLSELGAAEAGDAVVIMGARDDSLTVFARTVLEHLS